MVKRSLLLIAAVALSACGGFSPAHAVPGAPLANVTALQFTPASDVLHGAAIGFSVDTPARAATAASEGVNVTILYGSAPGRGSALTRSLIAHHISVIDGGVSDLLYQWECYRTLTVKPPPKGYTWCAPSYTPIRSVAILLREVKKLATLDAARPYVAGYWVLDDWPYWDYGSAHDVLPQIRAVLASVTPGLPSICGFGAAIGPPGSVYWGPGLARNFSSDGCDAVGWYNYSPFGRTKPSNGRALDWSMKALLPAMRKSLERYGWRIAKTPLLGIGQAWSGSYDHGHYQPGLSAGQMRTQAQAFCEFGATSISWYAWDDSGDNAKTQTPNNSPVIAHGVRAAISACKSVWAKSFSTRPSAAQRRS